MEKWIGEREVELALASRDTSVLDCAGLPYCVSENFEFCVLLRRHAAWQTDEGWRDANDSPDVGRLSREVLNFFKRRSPDSPGFWFKTFVPEHVRVLSLKTVDSDRYVLRTNDGDLGGKFSHIPSLMWDLMTGDAESEEEITTKFAGVWSTRN